MKNLKYFVFTAAVCIFTLFILFSCSGGADGVNPMLNEPDTLSAEEDVISPADETEPEKAEYMGYIFPGVDYGGYEFKILNFEVQSWAYTVMAVEEQTGEVIDDAIYMRNAAVEETLNIKINDIRVTWGGMSSQINNSVRAGSNDYDIALLNAYESGNLAQRGTFLNLNDIPALNLDEPWWDQNANETLEVAGKLYFTTTDASVFTYDLMAIMYFNKQMHENLALENIYNLVHEGGWTMDKLFEMMRAAARDTDGDGVFTFADTWGLSTHAVQNAHFFTGGNMVLVEKDNNGYPVLLEPGDRFVSVYAKVREIFNLSDTTGYFISAGSNEGGISGKTPELENPIMFFMADRALFAGEVLSWARGMRESEKDFGIIPHPKYDVAQDSYYALMDANFPTLTIPVTQDNPEMTGVIMNALTAVSSTTLKPAYYDVTLNSKLLRDEESVAMLDIALENRVYDLAMIYGWGDLSTQLRRANFASTGENPITVFDRYADRTRTAIERMAEDFDAID